MATGLKGGFPQRPRRLTVTTGGYHHYFESICNFIQISNTGANPLRLYFYEADYDADSGLTATDGFIELAATTGYFEGPIEAKEIWLRGNSGDADAVLLVYSRRF